MAEKETVTSKKPPTAKKKAPIAHEPHINLLPQHFMNEILETITTLMGDFQQVSENSLIVTQRRRKIGAGIRNYGFIEKAADLATANPQYAQFFGVNDLRNAIKNIVIVSILCYCKYGMDAAVSMQKH